jgi:hypothetical protein
VDYSVYDGFGRPTEGWRGTSTASNNASVIQAYTTWVYNASNQGAITYSSGGLQLWKTAHTVYDVDGNVLQAAAYADPAGVAAPRTTYYVYDWQDREVGELAPSGVATITVLDNQGEATLTQIFAKASYSAGWIITSAANLRAQTRVLQISVMYKRTEFHSWALPRKAVHSGNLS